MGNLWVHMRSNITNIRKHICKPRTMVQNCSLTLALSTRLEYVWSWYGLDPAALQLWGMQFREDLSDALWGLDPTALQLWGMQFREDLSGVLWGRCLYLALELQTGRGSLMIGKVWTKWPALYLGDTVAWQLQPKQHTWGYEEGRKKGAWMKRERSALKDALSRGKKKALSRRRYSGVEKKSTVYFTILSEVK